MKTTNTTTISNIENIDDGYYVSIEDSIKDILDTPKGTRLMLPNYGSDLYKLIDKRIDDEWILDFRKNTYEAITSCEPRVRDININIRNIDSTTGQIVFSIDEIELVQNGF